MYSAIRNCRHRKANSANRKFSVMTYKLKHQYITSF